MSRVFECEFGFLVVNPKITKGQGSGSEGNGTGEPHLQHVVVERENNFRTVSESKNGGAEDDVGDVQEREKPKQESLWWTGNRAKEAEK